MKQVFKDDKMIETVLDKNPSIDVVVEDMPNVGCKKKYLHFRYA